MTEEITKGVTCIKCDSVVFTINNLILHMILEPTHRYWKFSDKGVLLIKLFMEVKEQ